MMELFKIFSLFNLTRKYETTVIVFTLTEWLVYINLKNTCLKLGSSLDTMAVHMPWLRNGCRLLGHI